MQDEYMLYTEVKLLAEVEEIIQGVQRQFEKQQDLILDCKQEGRHQDQPHEPPERRLQQASIVFSMSLYVGYTGASTHSTYE